ncbi:MAG TPA: cupin domain-containing protein [Dermatophilaceae bacterium]|nr:cupin domain-containing protein [Dermatophilaceae bacterium]
MSGLQAFDLSEIEARQAEAQRPYFEFLRRPGFSMGTYLLRAGASDHQTPHSADEVYVVLRGSGTLRVEGEDTPAKAGSVLSVDQGKEHQFVDVSEDLQVLVIFAPPEDPQT